MIPRNKIVYEIIQDLNKERLVTVYGNSGIGKKYVTNKVAHLLQERSYFKNGVMHVLVD